MCRYLLRPPLGVLQRCEAEAPVRGYNADAGTHAKVDVERRVP